MPLVTFVREYSYTLKHRAGQPTLVYPKGKTMAVPTYIKEDAIKKGAAVEPGEAKKKLAAHPATETEGKKKRGKGSGAT